MKISSTSERLLQIMQARNLKQVDILRLAEPYCKKNNVKLNRNDLSQYVNGKVEPGQTKLYILGQALNVSEAWLMGFDVPMNKSKLVEPEIATDVVTFPVVGSIAAGYDEIAVEDWSGETIDIPASYLRGHKKEEFFVLSVHGDSMYPIYMDGDKVLVLRQSTLNRSGEIGAVLYEGENATLKKVEYVKGEDWMRLVPINPEFKPKTIEGAALEQCRVLGVPRLLVRDIK